MLKKIQYCTFYILYNIFYIIHVEIKFLWYSLNKIVFQVRLMVDQLSEKITQFFYKTNIVSENELNTFRYCFKIFFMLFTFLCCTLPFALFLNIELPTLAFLFSFLSLRSVAGGFHTATPEHCLVLSIISYFLFLLINSVYKNTLLTIAILLIATIIIIIRAPIEASNYPLSLSKRRRHKIQCIVLLIFFIVIYILSSIFNVSFGCSSIFTTILFTCIAVLITK